MEDDIRTSAEAMEASAIPRCREVHADPERCQGGEDITEGVDLQPVEEKSPAQWAYERLILYIQNFEKTLDNEHEVAMGFAGDTTGVIRIEGMGYFGPGHRDVLRHRSHRGQDPAGAACEPAERDAASPAGRGGGQGACAHRVPSGGGAEGGVRGLCAQGCPLCGTNPPFADAAIVHAEHARVRSGGVWALQRIFRLQTFERMETGKIQTALPRQPE